MKQARDIIEGEDYEISYCTKGWLWTGLDAFDGIDGQYHHSDRNGAVEDAEDILGDALKNSVPPMTEGEFHAYANPTLCG